MPLERGRKGSSPGSQSHSSVSCVEVPEKAEGIILTENAANFLRGSFQINNVQHMNRAVLYQVKTNAPSKFKVRPLIGYIQPLCHATVSVQSIMNTTDPRLVISGNDKFLVKAMPVSEDGWSRIVLLNDQKENRIYSDSSSDREIQKKLTSEQNALLTKLWVENESGDGTSLITEKHVISISMKGSLNDHTAIVTESTTSSVAPMDADSTSKIRKPLLPLNSETCETEVQTLISRNKALNANIEWKNKLIDDLKSQLKLRTRMGQLSLPVADGSSSAGLVTSTSTCKSLVKSSAVSDGSGAGAGNCNGDGDINHNNNGGNSNLKLVPTQASSVAECGDDIKVFPMNPSKHVVEESNLKPGSMGKVTVDELFAGKLGQVGTSGVVNIKTEGNDMDIKSHASVLDFKINCFKSKIELLGMATFQKLNGVFPVKIGSITDNKPAVVRQVCMSLVMSPSFWYELHICFPKNNEASKTNENSDDFDSENNYGECFFQLKFLDKNGIGLVYHHLSCSPQRGRCANSTSSHLHLKNCSGLTYSSPPIATWHVLNQSGCFFAKQSFQNVNINYVNLEVEMLFMRFFRPMSPLESYNGGKTADDPVRRNSVIQKLNMLILMSNNGPLELVTSELSKKVVIRCGMDLTERITVLYSIISVYSPVFELICKEAELTKSGVPTISAPYVSQESMEIFSSYIQCGDDDDLWLDNFQANFELFVFAQAFLIPELAHVCTRNLIEMDDKCMTLEQALCLILAGKKHGISPLTKKGVRWMEAKKNELETGSTKTDDKNDAAKIGETKENEIPKM